MVDLTGDFIWVQCDLQQGQYFDTTRSSSYRNFPCGVEPCSDLEDQTCLADDRCVYKKILPGGSPAQGFFSSETFIVPNATTAGRRSSGMLISNETRIGCGNQSDVFLGSLAARIGIIGNQISSRQFSFLNQIMQEVRGNFSHCFSHTKSPRDHGNSNIAFGYDAKFLGTRTELVPCNLFPGRDTVTVALEGISVNADRLNLDPLIFKNRKGCGAVLESGTPVTYLPEIAVSSVVSAVRDLVQNRTKRMPVTVEDDFWRLCYRANQSEMESVELIPLISLHFKGGVEVSLPPLNTFVEAEPGVYCLMIKELAVADDISIIGTSALQDVNVAYNLENNFAYIKDAAGCGNPQILTTSVDQQQLSADY